MRALVGAEPVDHFGELRVVAVRFELVELASVVAVNLFFDRGGAGHRRLGTDQREVVAEDDPDPEDRAVAHV